MTDVLKLTPLNDIHERLGARWQEAAGWRCAEAYTDPEREAAQARAAAGLADVSAMGKFQIEGALAAAAAALRSAYSAAPDPIGAGARVADGELYRVRADQYFLLTPPAGQGTARDRLNAAAAGATGLVTATDLTHGLSALRLVGPQAAAILRRVCGLDFAEAAFPSPAARQSSVAKTKQLILRHEGGGLPAYTIIGARSLAAYLWGVLLEAGHAEGLAPIGLAAVQALEAR
jgi:heterotetrameric sarcosine oxidase gamma subunit